MKLKRIFVCEMDETEKALLEETVKVLKESKDSFEYYKNNFGGDIYKEYENTIDFLERLEEMSQTLHRHFEVHFVKTRILFW